MKKITHFLRSSATAQALVLFSLFPSLVLWTPSLQANPAGGIVTGGAAEIGEGLGGHLQIMQHSNRAVIDWASFSIAAGELTQFVQPGADAAVLNRVSGGTPSAIMGALQANGNVAVINTAGILVGPSGTIDVNGLLLSTLDVSNADFMAGGDMLFRGAGDAGVTNMGRINAVGGDVFLLGKTVVNSGTISAANGTVGLAAGEEVLITAVADPAGERVFVRPTAGVGGGTGVDNSGTIEGAMVELKAHGNMYALAINNSGSIRATGATKNGGKVTLRAIGGTISNSGSIAATLPDGTGGRIMIDAGVGGTVNAGGTIDASAKGDGKVGGVVMISGESVTVPGGAEISANGEGGGGFVQIGSGEGVDARSVAVEAGSSISANGGSGPGGMVVISGGADSNVMVAGAVSATSGSGDGGIIIVEGGDVSVTQSSTLDASGANGGVITVTGENSAVVGGTLRSVGNNGNGGMINISGGNSTTVGPTASIDAGGSVNGGMVSISGGGTTSIAGTVNSVGGSGSGGTIQGLGAAVEMAASARVDASGLAGGGQVNIGGGFQGKDPEIQNATNTTVESGARIAADATGEGDGGTVVVWADHSTIYRGEISARAFGGIGNGGNVEVSGKRNLNFDGTVSTLSANGRNGNLLLDPTDFDVGGGTPDITAAALVGLLGANNVVISTNPAGAGDGTVSVLDDVVYSQANDFTILAHGDVLFDASLQNGGDGAVNVVAGWDGTTGYTATTPGSAEAGVANMAAIQADPNAWGNAKLNGGFGSVLVGDGAQAAGIAVGSAGGATSLLGYGVSLTAGASADDYVQVGYLGGAATGEIRVDAKEDGVGLDSGGFANSYTQIGHGGLSVDGAASGDVIVNSVGSVLVNGGTSTFTYAQIGHRVGGASSSVGAAEITVNAGDDVILMAGNRDDSTAKIGHGDHNKTLLSFAENDVTVSAGRNVQLISPQFVSPTNTSRSSTQIGHGGMQAHVAGETSGYSGDIDVTAGGKIDVIAAKDARIWNYSLIGHTAYYNDSAVHSGDINVVAGNVGGLADYGLTIKAASGAGAIANSYYSFAAIGHQGSNSVNNSFSGDIDVDVIRGGVTLTGGEGTVTPDNRLHQAQIGHGGYQVTGNMDGSIRVAAESDILLSTSSGRYSPVQIGHGGYNSDGTIGKTGDLIEVISRQGNLELRTDPTVADNIAFIGNGGLTGGSGARRGDILVDIAGEISFVETGGHVGIGHLTGTANGISDAGVTIKARSVDLASGDSGGSVFDVSSSIGDMLQADLAGGDVSLHATGTGGLLMNSSGTMNYSSIHDFTMLSDYDVSIVGSVQNSDGSGTGDVNVVAGWDSWAAPLTNPSKLIAIDDMDVQIFSVPGAYGNHGGEVLISNAGGSAGVGSRTGESNVAGDNVTLTGTNNDNGYAQIGYDGTSATTGNIEVHALQQVTLTGGSNYDNAHAQIGHGGYQQTGDRSGNITVEAGNGVLLYGDPVGTGRFADAHIGHGGRGVAGGNDMDGNITVRGGEGEVSLIAGQVAGTQNFRSAQIGHGGGYDASGNFSGTIRVTGSEVNLAGGGQSYNYARIGHGGWVGGVNTGDRSGYIYVNTPGEVSIDPSVGVAQIGHHNEDALGTIFDANVTIVANSMDDVYGDVFTDVFDVSAGIGDMLQADLVGGEVTLHATGTGGMLMNSTGSMLYSGSHNFNMLSEYDVSIVGSIQNSDGSGTGNVNVVAGWDPMLAPLAAPSGIITIGDTDAQIFNTPGAYGNHGGEVLISNVGGSAGVGSRTGESNVAGDNVTLTGTSAVSGYAQIGFDGTLPTTGDIEVHALQQVTLTGGSRYDNAHAQIGHGGYLQAGDRSGNITVEAGNGVFLYGDPVGTGRFAAARIGHGGRGSGLNHMAGDITVSGGAGEVSLIAGQVAGTQDFRPAQIGHGGAHDASGDFSGNIRVTGSGVNLAGGGRSANYARIGHGGGTSGANTGNRTGYIFVSTPGEVSIDPSTGDALIGHHTESGTINANVTIEAGSMDDVYGDVATNVFDVSDYIGNMLEVNLASGDVSLHATGVGGLLMNSTGTMNYSSPNDLNLLSEYGVTFMGSLQNSDGAGTGSVNVVAGWDPTTAPLADPTGIISGVDMATDIFGVSGAYGKNNGEVLIGDGTQTVGVVVGSLAGETNAAGSNISLLGGSTASAYAQLGYRGASSGDITVEALNGVNVIGGLGAGSSAYAQIGSGGASITGVVSNSDISVDAGVGAVVVTSGSEQNNYAKIGHGGDYATGDKSGSIDVRGNGVVLTAGLGRFASAQIGHGGRDVSSVTPPYGDLSGSITVDAGIGEVNLIGGQGGTQDFRTAQIGHGGPFRAIANTGSGHSGDITVSGGDMNLNGGAIAQTYTLIGHGGYDSRGDHSGMVTVNSNGNVNLTAGTGSASFAQIGHGGWNSTGNLSGKIDVVSAGDLNLVGVDVDDRIAMIGHGWVGMAGSATDDVWVRAGRDMSMVFGRVGHASSNYVTGDTFLGIGRSIASDGANSRIDSGSAGQLGFFLYPGASDTINTATQLNGVDHGAVPLPNLMPTAAAFADTTEYPPTPSGANPVAGNFAYYQLDWNGYYNYVVELAEANAITGAGGLGAGEVVLSRELGQETYGALPDFDGDGIQFIRINSGMNYTSANDLTFRTTGSIIFDASVQNNGSGAVHVAAGWDGTTDAFIAPPGTVPPPGAPPGVSNFGSILGNDTSWGNNNGRVRIGDGLQTAGIVVGSMAGETNVLGYDVSLSAGSGTDDSAQIGYRGAGSGDIAVYAQRDVSLIGGSGQTAFAQIGHGGYAVNQDTEGDIWVEAGGAVSLAGGTNTQTWTQIGHGGRLNRGNHGAAEDETVVIADRGISLRGGNTTSYSAYAQIGNSIYQETGDLQGDIYLNFNPNTGQAAGGGDLLLLGSTGLALSNGTYAQVGHGSRLHDGLKSGDIRIDGFDNVSLTGGGGNGYAKIGHGGQNNGNAAMTGDIALSALGDVGLTGGTGDEAFAQIGHGGSGVVGSKDGDIYISSGGTVAMNGGTGSTGAFAKIGHGGNNSGGIASGSVFVQATQDLVMQGQEDIAFAQIGHGGAGVADGNTGDIGVVVGGNARMAATDESRSNAQIGHGGWDASGVQTGDIVVSVVGDLELISGNGSLSRPAIIGHGAGNATATAHVGDIYVRSGGEISLVKNLAASQIGHYNSAAGNNAVILAEGMDGVAGNSGTNTLTLDTNAWNPLEFVLNGGGEVTVGAIGNGSLVMDASNATAYTSTGELNLFSMNDVSFPVSVQNSSTGDLNVVAGWDGVGFAPTGSIVNPAAVTPAGHGPLDLQYDPPVSFTYNFSQVVNGNVANPAKYGLNHGEVFIGNPTAGVRVGSLAGTTHVLGHNVSLAAGTTTDDYAQIGYRGAGTGDTAVYAVNNVNLAAGSANGAFAQIGHGGRSINQATQGNIRVKAGGGVGLMGGTNLDAYTQIGHGGKSNRGNHGIDSDTIVVIGGQGVTMATSGGASGQHGAYAQIGNGGYDADGELRGDISVTSGGGDLAMSGGSGVGSDYFGHYAQIGHGGRNNDGSVKSGDILVDGFGNVSLNGAGTRSYVQIGHGGNGTAQGDSSGDITVNALNDLTLQTGFADISYVQIGHGGENADGTISGAIKVASGRDVSITSSNFLSSYAQVGHGGYNTGGAHSGFIDVFAARDLDISSAGTTANNRYAMIGHRSWGGTVQDDIWVRAGQDMSLVGSAALTGNTRIGSNGTTYNSGNTWIGVGNDLSADEYSRFDSAAFVAGSPNDGELRFYIGGADNIAATTLLNGSNHTSPFPNDMGAASFVGDGAYSQPSPPNFPANPVAGNFAFYQLNWAGPYNYVIDGAEAAAITGALGSDEVVLSGELAQFSYGALPDLDGGTQFINVNSAIIFSSPNDLTFRATGDITFNASVQNQGTLVGDTGAVNVAAGWDGVTDSYGPLATLPPAHASDFTAIKNSPAAWGNDFPDVGVPGDGLVIIGDGAQVGGIAVGSRLGETNVLGNEVGLTAGTADDAFSQIGFRGAGGGEIVVQAKNDVALAGGTGLRAYAQVGHGGYDVDLATEGDIWVEVGGSVGLTGGNRENAYTQIGHGGTANGGVHGDIADKTVVIANRGINLIGGNATTGFSAYAQIGNGGYGANGVLAGDIYLNYNPDTNTAAGGGDLVLAASAGGGGSTGYVQVGHGGRNSSGATKSGDIRIEGLDNISISGGKLQSYAQIGHGGGGSATGAGSGSIVIDAAQTISLQGGAGARAYAQIGHGGEGAAGVHGAVGDTIVVTAGDGISALGGTTDSYVQIGNGGNLASGSGHLADITVIANGAGGIDFKGGTGYYSQAQIGHGGYDATGGHSGSVDVSATGAGGISFAGGGTYSWAQIGHGGRSSSGGKNGTITVSSATGIHFQAKSGSVGYAKIGHGGTFASGAHSGSIDVSAGSDGILFDSGAGVGSHRAVSIGHGGYSGGGDHSGQIDVATTGDVIFTAGIGSYSTAQIGHGGYNADGNHAGAIHVDAGGMIDFAGGSNTYSYAQLGHGGYSASGNHSDPITVNAEGNISFTSGTGVDAYAQLGHGGGTAGGRLQGNIAVVSSGGGILFDSSAGGERGYAQLGHGGDSSIGDKGGAGQTIQVTAADDVELLSGGNVRAYAQIGHGGYDADADAGDATGHVADISVVAGSDGGGSVTLLGGGVAVTQKYAYTQIGNGGSIAGGDHGGSISVTAADDVTLRAGNGRNDHAMIGHGGFQSDRLGVGHSGSIDVTATNGSLTMTSSPTTSAASYAYAQIGHGGFWSDGSHDGAITVEIGDRITMNGGVGSFSFKQIGHGGYDPTGNMSGTISVNAVNSIDLTAGTATRTWAQIGHGGHLANGNYQGAVNVSSGPGGDINLSGGNSDNAYAQIGHGGSTAVGTKQDNVNVVAGGDIALNGGGGTSSFAQIGHGGFNADGNTSGSINVTATDSVSLQGGGGEDTYAMIGNGGGDASGSHGVVGDIITVTAGDGISALAGTTEAYVQIGNGGNYAAGTAHAANIMVTANGAGGIDFRGGTGDYAYAQIGHGGYRATGAHTGSVAVTASGAGGISFAGGVNRYAWAQIGHGGRSASGTKSGDIRVSSADAVRFESKTGTVSYAKIGHGGTSANGNHSGNITVNAGGAGVILDSGAGSGSYRSVEIGHGSWTSSSASNNLSGEINVTTSGDVSVIAGSTTFSVAQIGHGGHNTDGTKQDDIYVVAGGSVDVSGGAGNDAYAQIGHGGHESEGVKSGLVSVRAGTTIAVDGGTGASAYGQIGHGGDQARGTGSGRLEILAQSISFSGGAGVNAYAQYGHGGHDSDAGTSASVGNTGDISMAATTGDILFSGGSGLQAYAQLGHGGYDTTGANSGNVVARSGGDFLLTPGTGAGAYVQAGHGGTNAAGDTGHTGSLTISAGTFDPDLQFTGVVANRNYTDVFDVNGDGVIDALDVVNITNNTVAGVRVGAGAPGGAAGAGAYSQIGHGGMDAHGNHGAAPVADGIYLESTAGLQVNGGGTADASAQVGHGGQNVVGNLNGRIKIGAEGGISVQGGTADRSYAQIGLGGHDDVAGVGDIEGDKDGMVVVFSRTGNVDVTGGAAAGAYGQVGHGGLNNDGDFMTEDLGLFVFAGSTAGPASAGDLSVTTGAAPGAYGMVGLGDGGPLGVPGSVSGTGDRIGLVSTGANGNIFDLGVIGNQTAAGNIVDSGSVNLAGGDYYIGLPGPPFQETGAEVVSRILLADYAVGAAGSIFVNQDVVFGSGNDFSLMARDNILVNASIQNSQAAGGGDVSLIAGWDEVTGLGTLPFIWANTPPAGRSFDAALVEADPLSYGIGDGITQGLVRIGDGSQARELAVGSRSGTTRVLGHTLALNAGAGNGDYARIGFQTSAGNTSASGAIKVAMKGAIALAAGPVAGSHAQIGHGATYLAGGTLGGDISVVSEGLVPFSDITLTGGAGLDNFAQVGHGGVQNTADKGGSILVRTGDGDVQLTSGAGEKGYSQVGHGGVNAGAPSTQGGAADLVEVDASGSVTLRASDGGLRAYSQIGNGGFNADAPMTAGDVRVRAGDTVSVVGGAAQQAYAQVGHGGGAADGDKSGVLIVEAGDGLMAGSVALSRGAGSDAYAKIGHGDQAFTSGAVGSASGTIDGGIQVTAGEGMVSTGGMVGHVDPGIGGPAVAGSGSTFVAVSRNDFPATMMSGDGTLVADAASVFSSGAGGELRFYMPRRDSNQVAAGASLNGTAYIGGLSDPALQRSDEFYTSLGQHTNLNTAAANAAGLVLNLDPVDAANYSTALGDYSFYFDTGTLTPAPGGGGGGGGEEVAPPAPPAPPIFVTIDGQLFFNRGVFGPGSPYVQVGPYAVGFTDDYFNWDAQRYELDMYDSGDKRGWGQGGPWTSTFEAAFSKVEGGAGWSSFTVFGDPDFTVGGYGFGFDGINNPPEMDDELRRMLEALEAELAELRGGE